jgi:hypothetical protein
LVLSPVIAATTTVRSMDVIRATQGPASRAASPAGCGRKHNIVCITVRPVAPGGPSMHASVCPAAVSVTVDYDAPTVVPRRTSMSRTVEAGSCAD